MVPKIYTYIYLGPQNQKNLIWIDINPASFIRMLKCLNLIVLLVKALTIIVGF